jgi:DNA-binding HxlR family transcriptional regulator
MPRNPPFVYKTSSNLVSELYLKDKGLSKSVAPPAPSSQRDLGEDSLEEKFLEFGELASAFVRDVSSVGGLSRRGETSSVEVNVNITKKVFSKWSIEILMSIYSLNSVGFGDLKRLLNGISSRVLSKKLKDLEELGFVEREVIDSRPPKVRYALSKRGEVLARLGEPVILYLRKSMK